MYYCRSIRKPWVLVQACHIGSRNHIRETQRTVPGVQIPLNLLGMGGKQTSVGVEVEIRRVSGDLRLFTSDS